MISRYMEIVCTSSHNFHLVAEITLTNEQSLHVVSTSRLNDTTGKTDIKAVKHLSFGPRSL